MGFLQNKLRVIGGIVLWVGMTAYGAADLWASIKMKSKKDMIANIVFVVSHAVGLFLSVLRTV